MSAVTITVLRFSVRNLINFEFVRKRTGTVRKTVLEIKLVKKIIIIQFKATSFCSDTKQVQDMAIFREVRNLRTIGREVI